MKSETEVEGGRRFFWGLGLLLIVSFALRLILVVQGGQGFWGDESRYDAVCHTIHGGSMAAPFLKLIESADHIGFKILSLIPAVIQAEFGLGSRVGAVFVSLFSTACIFWIWLIARRSGGGRGEALAAAFTFGCSSSMLYWSRHLVPYDVAMFWGLACLYVSIKPTHGVLNSFIAGLLGLATFLTYNGYWTMVALILIGHVAFAWSNWQQAMVRAGAGMVGLGGGFVVLLGVTNFLGADLWGSFTQFAGTITQGDFSEGHLVIWEYLWGAESAALLIWLGAAVGLLVAKVAGMKPARRGWWWLGGLGGVAVVLIAGSNVFEKFVVYGRVVRQMVPVFALLLGYVLFGMPFVGRWIGPLRIAVVTALLSAAFWNFSVPLVQEFPNDFHYRSSLEIGRLRMEAEAKGVPPIAPDRFQFINVGYLWPWPTPAPEFVKFRELRVRAHPLSYRPFLFEGFNHVQRDAFLKADIRMKLIVVED